MNGFKVAEWPLLHRLDVHSKKKTVAINYLYLWRVSFFLIYEETLFSVAYEFSKEIDILHILIACFRVAETGLALSFIQFPDGQQRGGILYTCRGLHIHRSTVTVSIYICIYTKVHVYHIYLERSAVSKSLEEVGAAPWQNCGIRGTL